MNKIQNNITFWDYDEEGLFAYNLSQHEGKKPYLICFLEHDENSYRRYNFETDEFEAVRLVDMLQLSQQEAALEMQVSRQTFANILKSSRKKITTALVQGNALLLKEIKE